MQEHLKMRVETNREILVFWAILIFTCVVGIIELLPEIDEQKFSDGLTISLTNAQSYVFLIYFGLLIGMVVSTHSAFSRYRESNKLVLEGKLGEELKEYAKAHPTWVDKIIRSKADWFIESILVVLALFVFTCLYCVKLGLLK